MRERKVNTLKNKKVVMRLTAATLCLILAFSGFSFSAFAYTGNISKEIIAKSAKTAVKIEGEGIVLLKNEGNTLPLESKKINVFGSASVSPYLGGTGSGAISSKEPLLFYDALKKAGIAYNEELKKLYEDNNENKILQIGNTVADNLMQMLMLKQKLKEMPAEKIGDDVI
jgi:beta-glucosidase-like glycosyl hydrolase